MDNEDVPDPQEVLKVEEHAVVLALRDTYMPGLDGSDAVMFATLLADLFPNVQVPMIFESYGSQGSRMQMNEQVSNLEEIPVLSKAPGEPSGDNVDGTYRGMPNVTGLLLQFFTVGNYSSLNQGWDHYIKLYTRNGKIVTSLVRMSM